MKKAINTFCLLLLILVLTSCNRDLPKCGYRSETLDTVPSDKISEVPKEAQTSGVLFYKTLDKVDGHLDQDGANNRFWIYRGVEGCSNCQHHFIVLNEQKLGRAFNYLKESQDSVKVFFEGDLKLICGIDPFIAPGDYVYKGIKLTSIRKR